MESPRKIASNRRCNVPGCRNKADVECGISLYRFPDKDNDLARYKLWLKVLKLKSDPKKTHFVCSAHFKITDFHSIKHSEQTKLILNVLAVPSLNLPYEKKLHQEEQDPFTTDNPAEEDELIEEDCKPMEDANEIYFEDSIVNFDHVLSENIVNQLQALLHLKNQPIECESCQVQLQRFVKHLNDNHYLALVPFSSLLIDEIIESLSDSACLANACSECKIYLAVLAEHISSIHQAHVEVNQSGSMSRTRLLELCDTLLNQSWFDECSSCQECLENLAVHVESHKVAPSLKDFSCEIDDNEEMLVEQSIEDTSQNNDDHNYSANIEIDEEVMVDPDEVDKGAKEVQCQPVNEYLTNTTLKVYFKVHVTENSGSLYTCTICNCVCRRYEELMEHFQEHADTDAIEDLTADKNYKIDLHIETGRGKKLTTDFQCGVCEEINRSRNRTEKCLELHKRYAQTDNDDASGLAKALQCTFCEHTAANHTALQLHVNSLHDKDFRVIRTTEIRVRHTVKCQLCQLTFPDIQQAIVHRREYHLLLCDQALSGIRCVLFSDGTEVHERRQKFSYAARSRFINEFQCICNSSYTSEQKALVCLGKHVGVKNFMCSEPGCEREYFARSELEQHERRKHRKLKSEAAICDICGKSVGQVGMRAHQQWHDRGGKEAAQEKMRNRQSRRPKKCPVCSKVYSGTAQLQRHIQVIHNQVKRHSCSICAKKFLYYQAADLCEAKHKNSEKTIQCSYCDKMFYTRSQKMNHQLQIHIKRGEGSPAK